jgi:hypothetical protein
MKTKWTTRFKGQKIILVVVSILHDYFRNFFKMRIIKDYNW